MIKNITTPGIMAAVMGDVASPVANPSRLQMTYRKRAQFFPLSMATPETNVISNPV